MKNKKQFLKIFSIGLIIILMLSLAGCARRSAYRDNEDSNRNNTKSGNTLSDEDEEAIEIIEKCMDAVDDGFDEELDSDEMQEIIENALTKLDRIDAKDCSQDIENLVDETDIFLNELYNTYEIIDDLYVFEDDVNDILISGVTTDLMDFTTLTDVENAYYVVIEQSDALKELECPQYFQATVNKLANVYNSYGAVLSDYYYSNNNDNMLGIYSALCIYEELQSDIESISSDMELLIDEFSNHLNNIIDRLNGLQEEINDNVKCIKNEKYDKLSFDYLDEDKKITASIDCIDTIYPAMYNRLDAVSILTLSCAQGKYDVLVSVEVDGYSQKYEKTITLGVEPQRLYIKPPVLSTGINLDTQKNTQIKVTISDVSNGNILSSETANVSIMSINDFILNDDEYGYTNNADILAWITPESPYIQEILRYAAENMGSYIGYEGIPGYQYVDASLSEYLTTALQVYAIQKAISDVGVRYVMSSYSLGEAKNYTQRINRPDETLLSKSGICVETSVLMASALQAAGFNSMIVFTTGHCQVAVETWQGSGDYLLIETTMLPVAGPADAYGDSTYLNSMIFYYTDEEWDSYLSNKNGYVYDCNMATTLGITPLTY